MERKIIQIVSRPRYKSEPGDILALCNDGTVWMRPDNEVAWLELPAIPQPQPVEIERPFAYQAGVEAAKYSAQHNRVVTTNPYCKSTEPTEFAHWMQGYDSVKR